MLRHGCALALAALLFLVASCHHAEKAAPAARSETPPIIVDDDFRERAIGLDLDLLEDKTGALTFADVRSPENAARFVPSTKPVPNFGYTKSAYWARFSLDDRRDTAKRASGDALELTLAHAPTDFAELWCVDSAGAQVVHARAGDHVLLADWPSTYREPSFAIPAAARGCVVRVESGASLQFPLTLRTRDTFASHRLTDTTTQCLYFGALLVMIAYNGLVALSSRSLAYGFYTLFLASYGLMQCALGGFGYALLWPDAVGYADRASPLFIALTGMTSIPFAALLLDLPRTSPRFWLLARVTLGLAMTHVCVMGFLSYSVAVRAVFAIIPFWAFVLLGSGVVQSWRGVRVAKLYLAAWTVFILGTLINMLRLLAVLPTNAFTVNANQIGSAIEFVLLSFALADRIKTLQAEVATQANLAREASERTNTELKRLDALKDDFLANTSHELRTPLHGMLGLSEAVLANPNLDAVSRERLNLVVASGRRLSSLVNDILDFSKLRHQEIVIREKNVDVAEAVKLALTVIAPMAAPKGLRLRSDVPSELIARADENRLQQILTNLLGNAVKFTESGEVVIAAERRNGRIFISVKDSGIGIPHEAQARIFESFEQADGSTSREYGGTGLGLAVSKKLTELHGGHLGVESEPGRGSTFTFDLAAADVLSVGHLAAAGEAHKGSLLMRSAAIAEVPSQHLAIAPDSLAASLAGPRHSIASAGDILVADDDPINVEVLRAQLEPEGYTVTTARDGREALAAFEAHGAFDAVLLDVMMPKMTGPEAAELMRASHPHGTLPILMLTAKSRPEDVVVGMRSGASDYLGKPFHREELLQRLDVHMQSVRTARAFRRFVPGDFMKLLGVTRFESLEAGVGQPHNITVLFTDIRDFTTRSEKLGPEGTFRFVNACLERFEPVVRANGGFVDKFIGDAVMAIFPGDPLKAVRAAEGLMAEVRAFNAARPNAPMPLAIGIGIHKGPVILGTVGDSERMDVTVIGDAVNVSSRLESLTKAFGAGALVSQDTLGSSLEGMRRVGAVRVKGRREPVELFEILACCGSKDEREQKAAGDERFQRGLRAYAQGDMTRAKEHFTIAAAEAPSDRLAKLYAEKATQFEQTGLPEGFEGELIGGL